jgi:hypothetical protein
MKELATLLGLALLAKNALVTTTILAKPPTGDDELDDLEVQRITKNRRRVKRAAVKRSGKLQATVYSSDEAQKYSKEDWQKGQLLGVLEINDPEKETSLGTGSYLLVLWVEEGEKEITLLVIDEKTKKIATRSQGMISKEKLPAKDLVRLEITEEKEGKGQCSVHYRRTIRICFRWYGQIICLSLDGFI